MAAVPAAPEKARRLIGTPVAAPAASAAVGRVLLLIRSLNRGGSERQLATLARALHERGTPVEVAVFYGGGAFEDELRQSNIPVHDLGKRSRWIGGGFLRRLAALLRATRPAVLYAFLPEANLVSLAARRVAPETAVVWGIRASYMDWSRFNWLGKVLFRIANAVSRAADLVIYNSEAGRRYHIAQGAARRRTAVVPNGIETTRFAPSAAARARTRQKWGLAATDRVIGYVGRIDPMKDHKTFLRAAALLARERPNVRFAIVGGGGAAGVERARRVADELELGSRVIWTGEVSDVTEIYPALDIATLTSLGEGFPNTVAEAMAAGVPCVVTDVGDACAIVADTGVCVPAGDAAAVCAGWSSLLALEADALHARGVAARDRIIVNYSVDAMAARTSAALVVARRRRATARRGTAPR